MSGFHFKCLNCGSSSVYAESDPRVSWERDIILHCYVCGWALYGAESVREAVRSQREAFRKDRAKESARRAAELPKKPPAPMHRFSDWEVLHRGRQQLRIDKGICANIDCGQPRRVKSTYCSRLCCVRNAHMRDRERKKARRKTRAA